MCDSNIVLNDCKLRVPQKSESLIACGEYSPSKMDDNLSLLSDTELSESCIKLSSSPSSFSEFRTSSPEKLFNDVCLSPDIVPEEDCTDKVHASSLAGENTENKLAAKYENKTYPEKSSKYDGWQLKKMDVFNVIGKGTTLMKMMNFPTVIVKHLSGTLEKSKVYYIILELETEESTGNIPAVMFSSPYAHRTTRYGELLPLGLMKNSKSFYLTPLLQRRRFRHAFRSGCSLKIKMLIPGRSHDDRGDCWNRYDLSKPAMQKLAKEFIELDIGRMSNHIFHRLIPLKHRIKNSKRMERKKTNLQRKPNETAVVNLEELEIPSESFYRTYLPFITNCKPIVQDSVGYSKALFSRTLSTKLNSDKDIKYSNFSRELMSCPDELDTYWCISVIT